MPIILKIVQFLFVNVKHINRSFTHLIYIYLYRDAEGLYHTRQLLMC